MIQIWKPEITLRLFHPDHPTRTFKAFVEAVDAPDARRKITEHLADQGFHVTIPPDYPVCRDRALEIEIDNYITQVLDKARKDGIRHARQKRRGRQRDRG